MYDYPPLEIIPNKKYTNFKTVIFPADNFPSRETAQLKIYGDSTLLYSNENITQKSKAVSIDIDITNVEILEIQLTDNVGEAVVWLQDFTFYRELTEDDLRVIASSPYDPVSYSDVVNTSGIDQSSGRSGERKFSES